MKIGLILEGGGMRGMYTAGVLDIFMDNNIEFDGIIGVSAGVLFGVNYLSKQRGRVLRYNKRFAGDKRFMGLHSLLTTGNIVNEEFSFYEVPQKLDVFDEEVYEKSQTEFYATITNVESGKPEYVKIENVFKQMEVLRATSAMPFVSKFVQLGDKKYLDGGIADSIPIEKCKSMVYDKIIVVLTRTKEYRKEKSNPLLAKLKYTKYPNLVDTINNRYLNYNESLDKINELEKNGEIFVIRPSKKVKIKRIENDQDKIQEMYDLGVQDSKEKMDALKEYLNMK